MQLDVSTHHALDDIIALLHDLPHAIHTSTNNTLAPLYTILTALKTQSWPRQSTQIDQNIQQLSTALCRCCHELFFINQQTISDTDFLVLVGFIDIFIAAQDISEHHDMTTALSEAFVHQANQPIQLIHLLFLRPKIHGVHPCLSRQDKYTFIYLLHLFTISTWCFCISPENEQLLAKYFSQIDPRVCQAFSGQITQLLTQTAFMSSHFSTTAIFAKIKIQCCIMLRSFCDVKKIIHPSLLAHAVKKAYDKNHLIVIADHGITNYLSFTHYQGLFIDLSRSFKLTLLSPDEHEKINQINVAEHIWISDTDDVYAVFNKINNIDAHTILYLGSGLDLRILCLQQYHIRAIQIHYPVQATSSFASGLDYALYGNSDFGSNEPISEKIIVAKNHRDRLILHKKYDHIVQQPKKPSEKIRIMVPVKYMKYSESFLQTCDAISRERSRIQFTFLTGLDNFLHDHITHNLVNRYPGCIVLPRLNYDALLDKLYQCELLLHPFPFSNYHMLIDGIALGKPFVALKGDAHRTLAAHNFFKNYTYYAHCIAQTTTAYSHLAQQFIDSGLHRDTVARKNKQELYDMHATSSQKSNITGNYAACLSALIKQHAQITQTQSRVFSLCDGKLVANNH